MYEVDALDKVRTLGDLPPSEAGAPIPLVLAGENELRVAYYVQESPHASGGKGPERPADEPGELCALVRFESPCASFSGPPNDEAFSGHPLAARGLRPYGAFEILLSSWVRLLERRNSVHSRHRPERYALLRHFVLSFHDSTFECVAMGYSAEEAWGTPASPLARALQVE